MADTVHWSLEISKDTDASLRSFLARKFVEDAVRWRVLDHMVSETKAANAGVPPREIEAAIAESVDAVRSGRFSE